VFGILRVGLWVLAALALRGVRWAYAAYVVGGLLYLPAQVGFHLRAPKCDLVLDVPLAMVSLHNYAHVVLFALFFVMTCRQFRAVKASTFAWAAIATLVMGALVELAEGVSSRNCRLRDLVPDAAGAVLGTVIVLLWSAARQALRSRREATGRPTAA
jgi:hypothetical protein